MGYNSLSESGMTPDEQRAEATRRVRAFIREGSYNIMSVKERAFVTSMSDETKPVNVKQLFWLRDLGDKYL